jgi:hypothetical protein
MKLEIALFAESLEGVQQMTWVKAGSQFFA